MPDYPYFPFYVKDFVADIKVQAMNTECVGAYLLLLCAAWQENPPATLPQDDAILAAYSRLTPGRWQELKPVILSPFRIDNRRYLQPRLRREYDKLAYRSEKASESANARWKSPPNANASSEHRERNARAFGSGSESGSGNQGNGEGVERGVRNDSPFTLEAWAAAVKYLKMTEADAAACWAFYDSQQWVKSNGRPIGGDPRSLLTSWLSNKKPEATNSNGKPESVWELKQQLDAIDAEKKLLQSKVVLIDNKAEPWKPAQRKLAPETVAAIATLETRRRELSQKLAGLK